MAETIEYEQFDQAAGDGQDGTRAGDPDLQRLSEIPMELSVEIGRSRTTVGETLRLRVGSVIELEHDAGAPADLLINGTPIARGEVVVVDERYGLRITEILDAQDPGMETQSASADTPAGAGTDDGADAGQASDPEA
ncbi:MAG: flagellar motor switch protein FliN [Solirubrobacteraceae bacterium]